MGEIDKHEYLLCFIHKNKAYFTKNIKGESWWEDWIDSPSLTREGIRHYDESPNVKALYFEVFDKSICFYEPKYATIGNDLMAPWFHYWTIKVENGKEVREMVEIFSGMPMDKFIETIVNDGGLIYELREG